MATVAKLEKDKKASKGDKKSTKNKSNDEVVTLENFVSRMLPLIDLEKEAEIATSKDTIAMLKPEIAQTRGCAILNLKCANIETGLLGKTLLELQPNRGNLLPPHKFTPHDVVVLKLNKAVSTSASLGQGVVYRLKDDCITVAVDEIPEDGLSSPIRLEKVANEVTYHRLKDTLIQLSKGILEGPAADLVPVLFGSRPPTFSEKRISFTPYNRGLDNSQAAAVSKALGAHDVFLLHGPPGTGKTTAVLEIILQEVKRGSKVLACAASNIAVDNIVERLACHKVKLVRLGHPARLLPQILDCSLDAQVLKGDNSSLANDIRKEIKALNCKFLKTKDKRARGELRREIRQLAKEERKRQQKAISDVIHDSNVVLTTLTNASSRQLQEITFDVVVIDEAAQAIEVACWIAILKGRKCILAGDHLQLSPTIQSVKAEQGGLGRTLFERLASMCGNIVTSMLTIQYRMHHLIMDWSSNELYGGKVQAHESVQGHTLCDLEGVQKSSATEPTLILIDSSGVCNMEERKDEGDSSFNEGEAQVAMAHAKKLVECGVNTSEIGIITPYAAQVGVLKAMRSEEKTLTGLEISTVDGFQGREKEAIIISMVRSNEKKEVGFLSDHRRMNVAVTRARRQCCIVCDSETVSSDSFLKRLIEYFQEYGEYYSAMEYAS